MTDGRIRLVLRREGGFVELRGATPLDARRFNERFAGRSWSVPMREADAAPRVTDFDLCAAMERTFGPDVAIDTERGRG